MKKTNANVMPSCHCGRAFFKYAFVLILGVLIGAFVAVVVMRVSDSGNYSMVCSNGGATDEHGCCPGETFNADNSSCCQNDNSELCYLPLK